MSRGRFDAIQLETKSAKLSTDFGLEWATKLFGEEAINSLPKLTRGKDAGKPKGYVIWRKALSSGYSRDFSMAVKVGQMTDAWIGLGPLSTRGDAVEGRWLGRIQALASTNSGHALFEEGRQRYAREQAEIRKHNEELDAEVREELAKRTQI